MKKIYILLLLNVHFLLLMAQNNIAPNSRCWIDWSTSKLYNTHFSGEEIQGFESSTYGEEGRFFSFRFLSNKPQPRTVTFDVRLRFWEDEDCTRPLMFKLAKDTNYPFSHSDDVVDYEVTNTFKKIVKAFGNGSKETKKWDIFVPSFIIWNHSLINKAHIAKAYVSCEVYYFNGGPFVKIIKDGAGKPINFFTWQESQEQEKRFVSETIDNGGDMMDEPIDKGLCNHKWKLFFISTFWNRVPVWKNNKYVVRCDFMLMEHYKCELCGAVKMEVGSCLFSNYYERGALGVVSRDEATCPPHSLAHAWRIVSSDSEKQIMEFKEYCTSEGCDYEIVYNRTIYGSQLCPPHEWVCVATDEIVDTKFRSLNLDDDVNFNLCSIPHIEGEDTMCYFLSETEVTEKLWDFVMVSDVSKRRKSNKPVSNVSRLDCIKFVEKLNLKYGVNSNYIFRLPTEWELANAVDPKSYGEWTNLNSGGAVHDVKTGDVSKHGVYDLCGNLSEWTNNIDSEAVSRVFGSSWNSEPIKDKYLSNGFCFNFHSESKSPNIGFRLAADIKDNAKNDTGKTFVELKKSSSLKQTQSKRKFYWVLECSKCKSRKNWFNFGYTTGWKNVK